MEGGTRLSFGEAYRITGYHAASSRYLQEPAGFVSFIAQRENGFGEEMKRTDVRSRLRSVQKSGALI